MKTSELREFPGNADQEDETVMNFQPGVTPITLELQHGGQKHSVSLPTNNLDKSKKYYVTFTVNKPPQDGKTGEEQPQKVIVQAPHKAVEEGPYKIFDRANAKMGYFDRANAQKGFPLGNRSSQDPCKIFDQADDKMGHFDRVNSKAGMVQQPVNGNAENPMRIFSRVKPPTTSGIFDRANTKLNYFDRANDKLDRCYPQENGDPSSNIFDRANAKMDYMDRQNERLGYQMPVQQAVLQDPCKFFNRVRPVPNHPEQFPGNELGDAYPNT